MVENPGVFAALGRSRALVRGNGWQVFGVIVAIFAIILVVSIVIGSIGAIGDSFVLFFLVQLLLNVALAPIYALAAAVLYFALRDAHGQPVGLDPATGGFAPPQAPAAPRRARRTRGAGSGGGRDRRVRQPPRRLRRHRRRRRPRRNPHASAEPFARRSVPGLGGSIGGHAARLGMLRGPSSRVQRMHDANQEVRE